jgi:hypothetical protein
MIVPIHSHSSARFCPAEGAILLDGGVHDLDHGLDPSVVRGILTVAAAAAAAAAAAILLVEPLEGGHQLRHAD